MGITLRMEVTGRSSKAEETWTPDIMEYHISPGLTAPDLQDHKGKAAYL
jgi:hypothetical protein